MAGAFQSLHEQGAREAGRRNTIKGRTGLASTRVGIRRQPDQWLTQYHFTTPIPQPTFGKDEIQVSLILHVRQIFGECNGQMELHCGVIRNEIAEQDRQLPRDQIFGDP